MKNARAGFAAGASSRRPFLPMTCPYRDIPSGCYNNGGLPCTPEAIRCPDKGTVTPEPVNRMTGHAHIPPILRYNPLRWQHALFMSPW